LVFGPSDKELARQGDPKNEVDSVLAELDSELLEEEAESSGFEGDERISRRRWAMSTIHEITPYFNLALNTIHEITPYAEVYGLHPRDFNFGEEDSDSDSDSDDDEVQSGDLVELRNLKNHPELNGQWGTCQGWTKGRVIVRLDMGKTKVISAENVFLVD